MTFESPSGTTENKVGRTWMQNNVLIPLAFSNYRAEPYKSLLETVKKTKIHTLFILMLCYNCRIVQSDIHMSSSNLAPFQDITNKQTQRGKKHYNGEDKIMVVY
jgi:hypothetical protein